MTKGLLTLIMAGLMAACIANVDAAEPLRQVQSIPLNDVKGRIDHMAISPDGRHLFIAALGNNSIEIVDTQRALHSGGIRNVHEPQGVIYLASSKKLVVAAGGDGQCRFYDDALALTGTISDLEDADNIRYDPRAALLYVGYGQSLAIIDPQKPAKIADIKLDGHPESFQLEEDGSRIFINIPTSRHVAVVDRAKREVIAKWRLEDAGSNFPMALDEKNHRLFIGCRRPAKLLILDTQTGKTLTSLDCSGDADDVFYQPATGTIYISGGEGFVSVLKQIDADHYAPAGKVTTAPGARTSLLDPTTANLYIAAPRQGAHPAQILVLK